MSNLQQLRKTALQQIDTIGQKQRFGYFSIPANLAIGDPKFQAKKVQKDQNGRLITAPRNIYTKPTANGNTKSSYFELSKSIYDGDIYLDPGKYDRLKQLQINKKFEGKQVYKPVTSLTKTLIKASYQHIDLKPQQKDPKARRTEDGRVITESKNITTNPLSKVNRDLFKTPKYQTSPYDAEHKLKLKQMNENKQKLHQVPFKNVVISVETFSKNRQIFGELGNKIPEKKQNIQSISIAQHQAPFKPSNPTKSGYLGCIGKFPQYICTSPKQIIRNKSVQMDKKQHFKLSSPDHRIVPCPSITLNKSNLRKHLH